jgi:hypothetical protein
MLISKVQLIISSQQINYILSCFFFNVRHTKFILVIHEQPGFPIAANPTNRIILSIDFNNTILSFEILLLHIRNNK